MSNRKIIIDGDPVLRTRAAEVDSAEFGSAELQRLVADMVDSMYASKGVGIAAPQIGVGKRVLIAESPDGPIALLNPVITRRSKRTQLDEEGCLSVPGYSGAVERAYSISVRANVASGADVSFDAEEYFARIIQHEVDHLDGILFIDRMKEQGRVPYRQR